MLPSLQPPPIGYPPLPPPRRPVAQKPRRAAPRGGGVVSPFSCWSVYKSYRFPAVPDCRPVLCEILTGALSDQTRSECGLDAFNYFVRCRPPPAQCQADELLWALQLWAASDPATLVTHIFHESLDQVLGQHFPWAIFGKAKTLARRRDRRPW